MKIYLNSTYSKPNQQKNNIVVTKPKNVNSNENLGMFCYGFNDQQVLFKAKQTVTAKMLQDRNRLLKNLSEILATNVPELSIEDKAVAYMRRVLAFKKVNRNKIEDLKFQAELIMQNTHITPKQQYDELGKIEKEIKRLEKLKMPKEVKPPKPTESFDYVLINLFKNAINEGNFDLKEVFLEHYKDLASFKTVEEVENKYPHIKIPAHPVDVVAKKCIDTLDRSFFERLDDEFEKEHEYEDIIDFLGVNLLDTVNFVINEAYLTDEFTIKLLINKICEKALITYENVRFHSGFSSVPETKKQKTPDITLVDKILLHLDYDDYVLSVLRQQYLEGKKLSEIEYIGEDARLYASEPKEPEYKFDKLSEKVKKFILDAQKLKFAQRDYKNFTNKELTARLNYYANSSLGNIDEIFDIIVDFDACQYTPEDMRYMVKFLKELDYIYDNNLEGQIAIDLIREKDLRPHGTYKLNQLERQRLEEKRKIEQKKNLELSQHQKDFDEAITLLYEKNFAPIVEICSKYRPNTLDEKEVNEAKKIVAIISNNIQQNHTLQQLENEIIQWELFNEYINKKNPIYQQAVLYSQNFESEQQESKIGQYLWNADIVENFPQSLETFYNPQLLRKIMDKFSFQKGLAIEFLCKYEDYKLLDLKRRNSINEILEIFDNKDSNARFILKSIIENDYVLSDTVVEPESVIKTAPRTFASSAKQQILDKYRFPLCIEFFKAFEEALPLDAKALGTSGVKKTGRNNDSIEHKVELKIVGHDDRLFSSQNNYYFDIFSDVGLH